METRENRWVRNMEVHERKKLITKAKALMDQHGYNPLLAIKKAEEELEKQKNMGEER